jgi:uncharacterized membrane protein YbhN (UPF0104 family)
MPLARIVLLGAGGAVAWPVATHAGTAFGELRTADLRPVVAAALLHVAMLVASAFCWRRAFRACGGSVGYMDACVRYGVGTFLNAVTPARAGGAVRIGLFARTLEGEGSLQRSGTALLGIGSVRGAAVTLLVAGAALAGLAPRWLVVAPLVLGVAIALTRRRVTAVRAHLRRADAVTLFGWAALAAACRCASIGAALLAVGVSSPVSAAVIGLIGLELSALIPLAPGLAGVGGAAVAVAIAAHGVPSATAVAGGVAFYVAEAGAGIGFGLVTTAVFIANGGTTWRQRPSEGELPVPVW